MNPSFTEILLDELLPPFPEDSDMRAFALLDAARDDRIYAAVLRADCEWCCLYRGDAATTMAEVAPYLVELHRESRFTAWLIEEGWGHAWGIFINAPLTLEILRGHLRRFIYARLPDGRTVYFRFYDPRVLRVYLPTCNAEEVNTLFGPVERFVMESEERDALSFSRVGLSLAEVRNACS